MIPLDEQVAIFDARLPFARRRLHWMIDEYWAEIVDLARKRHAAGFEDFGDEMYHWEPARRLEEYLMELADAVNYDTSGPLPDD